jgi:VanZ family protein
MLWFWAPVAIWMALIFYFSSKTPDKLPQFDIPGIDKLFHFVEYFLLGFLLVRAFANSASVPNHVYILAASVIIASLYGASDEFHQRFVPGRLYDAFDLISDIIGSLTGASLSIYKEKIKNAVH